MSAKSWRASLWRSSSHRCRGGRWSSSRRAGITSCIVDGEWAFRFPRRAVVVSGTERELAVLGLLAPQLPVGVPVPVHIGRPTERFAWPFFGARFLPGVEAGEATLSDDERARMARPLARALRAVHGPAVLAELGGLLPFDPIRRADMALRVPRTRSELAAVAELGT